MLKSTILLWKQIDRKKIGGVIKDLVDILQGEVRKKSK
jgi:hypothetical protein